MKKNRGTRGDSLLILGSIEPLSKKPPLQAEWVSGGSMSLQEHCQNRKEARDINAKSILAEGLRQIIMS